MKYLSKVIFAFDKASSLIHNEHAKAFCAIFVEVMSYLWTLFADTKSVEIKSVHSIEWKYINSLVKESGRIYIYQVPFFEFQQKIFSVAEAMYSAHDSEFGIAFIGEKRVDIIVSADPIYFSLTAN